MRGEERSGKDRREKERGEEEKQIEMQKRGRLRAWSSALVRTINGGCCCREVWPDRWLWDFK